MVKKIVLGMFAVVAVLLAVERASAGHPLTAAGAADAAIGHVNHHHVHFNPFRFGGLGLGYGGLGFGNGLGLGFGGLGYGSALGFGTGCTGCYGGTAGFYAPQSFVMPQTVCAPQAFVAPQAYAQPFIQPQIGCGSSAISAGCGSAITAGGCGSPFGLGFRSPYRRSPFLFR